ncbi:unnamed protein product [Ectocarpus sp. 12 AP-2014]
MGRAPRERAREGKRAANLKQTQRRGRAETAEHDRELCPASGRRSVVVWRVCGCCHDFARYDTCTALLRPRNGSFALLWPCNGRSAERKRSGSSTALSQRHQTAGTTYHGPRSPQTTEPLYPRANTLPSSWAEPPIPSASSWDSLVEPSPLFLFRERGRPHWLMRHSARPSCSGSSYRMISNWGEQGEGFASSDYFGQPRNMLGIARRRQ